jgi:hypothetical protein
MKNNTVDTANIVEITLVILIGIFVSTIFFVEINSISARLNKVEDQAQAVQAELVNLRIKINSQATAPATQTPAEKAEAPAAE